MQCTGGKLRQSRVEPGQPSNIPAFRHQIPHPISHVLATMGPQSPAAAGGMLGTLGVLLTSGQAAPALRPLHLSLCHLPRPPAPQSWHCPGLAAPAHSWGGRGEGAVPCPVGQQQWVPWPPLQPAWLPQGAGPALGPLPLQLTGQGCSAVQAGTWLGTKGGSISGDPDPQ